MDQTWIGTRTMQVLFKFWGMVPMIKYLWIILANSITFRNKTFLISSAQGKDRRDNFEKINYKGGIQGYSSKILWNISGGWQRRGAKRNANGHNSIENPLSTMHHCCCPSEHRLSCDTSSKLLKDEKVCC